MQTVITVKQTAETSIHKTPRMFPESGARAVAVNARVVRAMTGSVKQ
jgi:hypothetical protein